MERSRFSEEHIITILKQQESSVATADVCREHRDQFGDVLQMEVPVHPHVERVVEKQVCQERAEHPI